MLYFCRILYDWKKKRLMEHFWWIWWLYFNFLLRRSCRGWMFWGVLSVHGEGRNTYKEDEVEEEQEVLGRCHAAFSHDATPGDTQTRQAFRGAEEQSGRFHTDHGDDGSVLRRGNRYWTTSSLWGSIVLHTRGAKGDQIIWDYGRKTKTVTWCDKEEA